MYFISTHFRLIACLALGAGSLVFWFAAPLPTVSGRPDRAADQWNLPADSAPDVKTAVSSIAARNLFGMTVASESAAKPVEWQVVGIAHRGKEHYVLVNVEGSPVASLREGDELPDGAKILTIEDNRFSVSQDGKRSILGALFKGEVKLPAKADQTAK